MNFEEKLQKAKEELNGLNQKYDALMEEDNNSSYVQWLYDAKNKTSEYKMGPAISRIMTAFTAAVATWANAMYWLTMRPDAVATGKNTAVLDYAQPLPNLCFF